MTPNYFLETNRLLASALGARSQFRRAVHARTSIFGGGRSGKRWAAGRRVKRLLVYLLAVLSIHEICQADITKLSVEQRRALQDVSHFREILAVTNLPPAVRTLCSDHNGRIAEPGQKWQVTDVVTDDTLPRKRLIWAATDGDYYVAHYESGGIGHSYHVLLARFKKGDTQATFLWHAVGERVKNYRALLESIEHNKLDDELEYAH